MPGTGGSRGTDYDSRGDQHLKAETQDPGNQTVSESQTPAASAAVSQAQLQPSSRWTTIDEDEEKQQLPQVGFCLHLFSAYVLHRVDPNVTHATYVCTRVCAHVRGKRAEHVFCLCV